MADVGTLHDALLDELKDLYNAEKQLTKALPKMAKNATSPELRRALTGHLKETNGQIRRLEKIFKLGAGKNRLAVYADITNALNAGTVTGLQVRVPSLVIGNETVQFGSLTGIITPRQTTLGARWSF